MKMDMELDGYNLMNISLVDAMEMLYELKSSGCTNWDLLNFLERRIKSFALKEQA
jgi:hypothetical protein